MKVTRTALFELYITHTQGIASWQVPFDIEDYSRFKYGDTQIAHTYAQRLVHQLLSHSQYLPFDTSPIYITSSAFRHVPTAAQSILVAFLQIMAQQASDLSLEYFKIHRSFLDGRDYAQLTPQERENVLRQADLSVDNPTRLENQTVWVIDDIRITGKHEEKVLQFLEGLGVVEVNCLYVANLQEGAELSWLEHYINHAWVKNLMRFEQLIHLPHFQLNARVCKFLLSYPCHTTLQAFLERLSFAQITTLFDAIRADKFDEVESYQHAFSLLSDIFHQKYMHKTTLTEKKVRQRLGLSLPTY